MSATASALSDPLFSEIDKLDANSFKDNVSRTKALASARALCRRLESPRETIARYVWTKVLDSLDLQRIHRILT